MAKRETCFQIDVDRQNNRYSIDRLRTNAIVHTQSHPTLEVSSSISEFDVATVLSSRADEVVVSYNAARDCSEYVNGRSGEET